MEQDKTLLADQPGRAAPPGKKTVGSILKRWRAFTQMDHIRTVCNANKKILQKVNKRFTQLLAFHDDDTNQLQRCLEITAECQRQAADHANLTLERHALHPAIETVFLLNGEIQELEKLSRQLVDGQSHCPVVGSLVKAITEAAKIADEKCACLGLQTICPGPTDEFDASECDIARVDPTDDPSRHKKVHQMFRPGLCYRGKVLQRAKVSLFRYSEPQTTSRKETI